MPSSLGSNRPRTNASAVSAIKAIASEAIHAIRDLSTVDRPENHPSAPEERRGLSLLDLPAEVRSHIFEYVFTDQNAVTREVRKGSKKDPDVRSLRFLSKQLYPELNRAFFKYSNFNIDRFDVVESLRHSATYFENKSFDHIRNLTVVWTPVFKQQFGSRKGDSSFIHQMQNLRCLTLDLLGCSRVFMPDDKVNPKDCVEKITFETRVWPLLFKEITAMTNPQFEFHVLVYVNELTTLRIDWLNQVLLQEGRYPTIKYLLGFATAGNYHKWTKDGLEEYRKEVMSMHLSLKIWGDC